MWKGNKKIKTYPLVLPRVFDLFYFFLTQSIIPVTMCIRYSGPIKLNYSVPTGLFLHHLLIGSAEAHDQKASNQPTPKHCCVSL